MATLSLTTDEVVRNVLLVAGVGRNAGDMDEATEADVRAIIRSGALRAYNPMVGEYAYQWRFLEKHASFSMEPVYETGTIAVSGGVVTLAAGTWPAWAEDGFMSVNGHVLFVTAPTSGVLCSSLNLAL